MKNIRVNKLSEEQVISIRNEIDDKSEIMDAFWDLGWIYIEKKSR